jgi:hypothetical protein
MLNEDMSRTTAARRVSSQMSHARAEAPWQRATEGSRDAYVAHAALIVKGRSQHQSVNRAVEYLHDISDMTGVDTAELASLIVAASERRASMGSASAT